jgi:hypothetical protein
VPEDVSDVDVPSLPLYKTIWNRSPVNSNNLDLKPITSPDDGDSRVHSDAGNADPERIPAAVRGPRDHRARDRRDWHLGMLLLTAAIVVLSAILQVRADQRVVVSGFSTLPIPEMCGMQIMFNRDCPGCGLTRSFIYLARGDWERSLAVHRFGWLLALTMVLQIPYRVLALRYPSLSLGAAWARRIGIGLAALLIANWFYNLLQVWPTAR